MKRSVLIFCSVFCFFGAMLAQSAYAKNEWKTGKISYAPPVRVSGLDDYPESDRYYDGDYVCVGGDEHHAPTCRTKHEWFYEKSPEHVSMLMEDGTVITFVGRDHGAHGPLFAFSALLDSWKGKYIQIGGDGVPTEGSFRYRLGRFHKDTGLQDVILEIPNFPEYLMETAGAATYRPNGDNIL